MLTVKNSIPIATAVPIKKRNTMKDMFNDEDRQELMNFANPEVLEHSYGQKCRLCASKWLRNQPPRDDLSLDHVIATCNAKRVDYDY